MATVDGLGSGLGYWEIHPENALCVYIYIYTHVQVEIFIPEYDTTQTTRLIHG